MAYRARQMFALMALGIGYHSLPKLAVPLPPELHQVMPTSKGHPEVCRS